MKKLCKTFILSRPNISRSLPNLSILEASDFRQSGVFTDYEQISGFASGKEHDDTNDDFGIFCDSAGIVQ